MSWEANTWASNLAPVPYDETGKTRKPSPSCAAVLISLSNNADENGNNAFPSVKTMMRQSRLSERTVRGCLDRLESTGIIEPCDPEIVAAYIKRADKRPQGWNLRMDLMRDDLDDDELRHLAASNKLLRPRILQYFADRAAAEAQAAAAEMAADQAERGRGAATAPRETSIEERGAAVAPRGVQPLPERGAAVAPETSFETKEETSTTTNPADGSAAAATDGANSTSKTTGRKGRGKKPVPEAPEGDTRTTDDIGQNEPCPEWLRPSMAQRILDNYVTWFKEARGTAVIPNLGRTANTLKSSFITPALNDGFTRAQIAIALGMCAGTRNSGVVPFTGTWSNALIAAHKGITTEAFLAAHAAAPAGGWGSKPKRYKGRATANQAPVAPQADTENLDAIFGSAK